MQELFKHFDWLTFTIFILPGIISLKVWALIVPNQKRLLKDEIGEAIAFGIFNAGVVAPLLQFWDPQCRPCSYGAWIVGFILFPILWPILLDRALTFIHVAQRRWNWQLFLLRSDSSFDHAFPKEGYSYFVLVHLKDGRKLGGYFGARSFAGAYPHSGDLYLEELWHLDDSGQFLNCVPDTAGVILRPDDYAFIELKRPATEQSREKDS